MKYLDNTINKGILLHDPKNGGPKKVNSIMSLLQLLQSAHFGAPSKVSFERVKW